MHHVDPRPAIIPGNIKDPEERTKITRLIQGMAIFLLTRHVREDDSHAPNILCNLRSHPHLTSAVQGDPDSLRSLRRPFYQKRC